MHPEQAQSTVHCMTHSVKQRMHDTLIAQGAVHNIHDAQCMLHHTLCICHAPQPLKCIMHPEQSKRPTIYTAHCVLCSVKQIMHDTPIAQGAMHNSHDAQCMVHHTLCIYHDPQPLKCIFHPEQCKRHCTLHNTQCKAKNA